MYSQYGYYKTSECKEKIGNKLLDFRRLFQVENTQTLHTYDVREYLPSHL
jgi:hypothetical protein